MKVLCALTEPVQIVFQRVYCEHLFKWASLFEGGETEYKEMNLIHSAQELESHDMSAPGYSTLTGSVGPFH